MWEGMTDIYFGIAWEKRRSKHFQAYKKVSNKAANLKEVHASVMYNLGTSVGCKYMSYCKLAT